MASFEGGLLRAVVAEQSVGGFEDLGAAGRFGHDEDAFEVNDFAMGSLESAVKCAGS